MFGSFIVDRIWDSVLKLPLKYVLYRWILNKHSYLIKFKFLSLKTVIFALNSCFYTSSLPLPSSYISHPELDIKTEVWDTVRELGRVQFVSSFDENRELREGKVENIPSLSTYPLLPLPSLSLYIKHSWLAQVGIYEIKRMKYNKGH